MSFLIRSLVAFVTFISIPGVAAAQTGPVVVELYTSQGCSSCPPADAMLTELSAMDGVIALALHVDYWDYIGWKDDFADPAYTQRQQGYAGRPGPPQSIRRNLLWGALILLSDPKR